MSRFKTWVSAARPRTLPLSIAGIITGTGLAIREGYFDALIFVFALLTTLGLQILSNFANDYGDGIKGTDNDERLGPMRALQSGLISGKEMKKAMVWTSVTTIAFAVILILLAFDSDQLGYVFLFLVLGGLSLAAAIKYTVGKTAYGYKGLGDIFVFLFFGLLGVAGSYFLYSHELTPIVWIPASIIGLLSTVVLNLNNMRDIKSDERSGKNTLAVILGETKARQYHSALIFTAFLLTALYVFLDFHILHALLGLPFITLGNHLDRVYKTKHPQDLDPEMKKVALNTVLFALLYLIIGLLY